MLTQPGIPNEYVLSTSCYGARLKTIEDQAFAAVAMGFRRLELGLLESPVKLNGFEDSRRETGISVRSIVSGCLDAQSSHTVGSRLGSLDEDVRDMALNSVRRHIRLAQRYQCPTVIVRGCELDDKPLREEADKLVARFVREGRTDEAKAALVAKYKAKLRSGQHHQNAAYAAMIESFDESVGRVRAHLRQRGLEQNTVIFVTSDNGGYLSDSGGQRVTDNYPLRSGKGSLYEGGVRVPFIAYWPGVTKAGAVCAEPIVSTDLFSTILEITGQTNAPGGDGLSIVPLLRDAHQKLPRDEFFFHYPHYYPTTTPVSAIRTREWKLLEYFEDNRLELYRLSQDPSEEKDLAASEPEQARQLHARLTAWRKEVGARLPTPNRK